MKLKVILVCPVMVASFLLVPRVAAQSQAPPQGPASELPFTGSIDVKVFDASGSPLAVRPDLILTNGSTDGPVTQLPRPVGSNEWQFLGLPLNTSYALRVEADGFVTQRRYVTIPPFAGQVAKITFYLVPAGKGKNAPPPPSDFALSPKAQKEVQKALKDLKSNKNSNARKHLEKAIGIAPNHPEVNYLMGLSYVRDHQAALAVPYLKKSLATDPSRGQAVMTLGMALYQEGKYPEVIHLFNGARAEGVSTWQAQWILAGCYLRVKNYEQGLKHAQEALKRGKKKAKRAELMVGQAYAGLGRRQEAIEAFEIFLKDNPHDPAAASVRSAIETLRKPPPPPSPAKVVAAKKKDPGETMAGAPGLSWGAERVPEPTAAPQPVAPPAPPAPRKVSEFIPMENWAPPDVDATKPPIISNAACHLPALLRKAGENMVEWVQDLQKFTATEDYQSVEIGRHGYVGTPFEKKFSYLVFVNKSQPNALHINEERRPTPILSKLGAPVIALGSPALALVFNPKFRHDYKWSCDGLGEWDGRPAWVVRFEQRTDRPTAALQSFGSANNVSLLKIKGIAWLSEGGDHVMHLETDLLKPEPRIQLQRLHFTIDYRLVAFRSHPVSLWLPGRVNLYIHYHGHAYHNYSHYSDYLLFWTASKQSIRTPAHP